MIRESSMLDGWIVGPFEEMPANINPDTKVEAQYKLQSKPRIDFAGFFAWSTHSPWRIIRYRIIK